MTTQLQFAQQEHPYALKVVMEAAGWMKRNDAWNRRSIHDAFWQRLDAITGSDEYAMVHATDNDAIVAAIQWHLTTTGTCYMWEYAMRHENGPLIGLLSAM